MGFINYKQADSRWGSKNYNGSSSMATAGCGPTSCAIIISGLNPKITPIDTMKYMQTHGDEKHAKFALYKQGTAWNGIPSCLRYFGCTDAHEINVNTSMSEVWKLMKDGYVGVFLFDGMPWTTQGHYVAVTNYKYENNKHYVYTRDPGGRDRTGWYAYETTMKGRVPHVWMCKINEPDPIEKPATKYDGYIPLPVLKKGSSGAEVIKLQKFLNWYCSADLKPDGNFGSKTEDQLIIFQRAEGLTKDAVYGNKSYKAALKYERKYPKENGRTILATLLPSESVHLMTSQTVQSMAVVSSDDIYIFYASRDGSNQTAKSYDIVNDTINSISTYTSLGHANGACYANGNFYICSYKGNSKTNVVTVINATSMKKTKTIILPVSVSGIAYDDGAFYGSKGSFIYIFDKNFKLKAKFKRKNDGTAQDIAARNGRIYSCRSYVKGSISYIDVYTSHGEYKGSYKVTADELESCDFDERGNIYYCTWNHAKLVRTAVKV